MCAVSAVINDAMSQWPLPWTMPPIDYKKYIEAVDEARTIDEANGEPFCSSPEKAEWQRLLEREISKHFNKE